MIPKIIHQIWMGPKKMPEDWMQTWRDKNPSMKYVLWREIELEKFDFKFKDKIHYLLFSGKAKHYNYSVASDIMRIEILDRFGGVYIDADSYCLEPIENEFFMKGDFFVGKIGDQLRGKRRWVNRVANGTIGSIPGHPVLKEYLKRISKHNVKKFEGFGGEMLTKCIKDKDVILLPVCAFTPKDWRRKNAPVEGKVYAKHMWGTGRKCYLDK